MKIIVVFVFTVFARITPTKIPGLGPLMKESGFVDKAKDAGVEAWKAMAPKLDGKGLRKDFNGMAKLVRPMVDDNKSIWKYREF